MTPRKPSASERVARKIAGEIFPGSVETAMRSHGNPLRRLAAWHLSALRAARGRTVGYCKRPTFSAARSDPVLHWFSLMSITDKPIAGTVARVVLVRRAKGGGR